MSTPVIVSEQTEVVKKVKKVGAPKKVKKVVETEETVVEKTVESVEDVVKETGPQESGGDSREAAKLLDENDDVEVKEKKPKKLALPAKYSKFMVFGYWFVENLNKKELLNDDQKQDAFNMLSLFATVPDQVMTYQTFMDDFKVLQKNIKTTVRQHEKAMKPKKPKAVKQPKTTDGVEGEKKRGRKKKVVTDTTDPQQQLIQDLVNAANSDSDSSTTQKPKRKYTKKNKNATETTSESTPTPAIVNTTTNNNVADNTDNTDDETELEVEPFSHHGHHFFIDSQKRLFDTNSLQHVANFIDNNIVPI